MTRKRLADYPPEEQERRRALARERSRTWRDRHPDGGRLASQKYRAKHGNTPWPAKRALGLEIAALKSSTPCTDCGQVFPEECMDFDHLDGAAKVNNVGSMVTRGWSREVVMAEIAKCELVCANCHRTRTKNRRSTSD